MTDGNERVLSYITQPRLRIGVPPPTKAMLVSTSAGYVDPEAASAGAATSPSLPPAVGQEEEQEQLLSINTFDLPLPELPFLKASAFRHWLHERTPYVALVAAGLIVWGIVVPLALVWLVRSVDSSCRPQALQDGVFSLQRGLNVTQNDTGIARFTPRFGAVNASISAGPINSAHSPNDETAARLSSVAADSLQSMSAAERVLLDRQVLRLAGVRLSVVFFTHVNTTSNWQKLLYTMVNEMIGWGLVHSADVHFVVSVEQHNALDSEAEERYLAIERLIRQMLRDLPLPPLTNAEMASVEIIPHYGNSYEWPGISRVWHLSQNSEHQPLDRHLILYYHSKGMINKADFDTEYRNRSAHNSMLSSAVVRPWRAHVQRFLDDSDVWKLGYARTAEGALWYNFWYARASYVRSLRRPKREVIDRYYYEKWLAFLDPGSVLAQGCAKTCNMKPLPSPDEYAVSFPCFGKGHDPGMGDAEECISGPLHTHRVCESDPSLHNSQASLSFLCQDKHWMT